MRRAFASSLVSEWGDEGRKQLHVECSVSSRAGRKTVGSVRLLIDVLLLAGWQIRY